MFFNCEKENFENFLPKKNSSIELFQIKKYLLRSKNK